jgi:hypothetical protein
MRGLTFMKANHGRESGTKNPKVGTNRNDERGEDKPYVF